MNAITSATMNPARGSAAGIGGASTPTARSGGEHLFLSFGVASLVVLLGVLGAWVLVKRAAPGEELMIGDQALDELPLAFRGRSRDGVDALLDQADVAFAAGRIVEPRFDNALYFYRAVIEQAPEAAAARAGMERIAQWLIGQMNLAMDAGDFDRAERLAAHLLELRPDDADVAERFARVARTRELTALASSQSEGGDSEAAALTYGRLLALDGDNLRAREGLRTALADIVAAGAQAATEGRLELARERLEQARALDPGAPGVVALAARLETMARATAVEAREAALAAIRELIRSGGVVDAPGADPALMIASFERNWPEAETVAALREELALALLEAARRAIAAGDWILAEQAVERVANGGGDAGTLAGLRAALDHGRYLQAFAQGAWTLRSISDLQVLEQVAPEYPARANRVAEGWVDLEFTVDATGRVTDPVVREASSRIFVASSLDAIQRWRFEAVRVGGRPVPARAVLRFTYRT